MTAVCMGSDGEKVRSEEMGVDKLELVEDRSRANLIWYRLSDHQGLIASSHYRRGKGRLKTDPHSQARSKLLRQAWKDPVGHIKVTEL
jgi:hypothetical protein